MSTTTTNPEADEVWVCAIGHASPFGDFKKGTRLRGDHPAVQAYAGVYFAPDGTPDSELPNAYAMNEERRHKAQMEAEQAAREAFEAEARRNPVTLSPRLVKSTRDFYGHIDGSPALVRKGSQALEADEIVRSYPEAGWK